MLHYWETSNDAQKNPYALPKTLGDFYYGYFKRLYDDEIAFQPVRCILEVLISAFGPMSVEEMIQVLHWKERSPPSEYELKNFKNTMKELGHFLRYGINDTVSLYHLSLVDWLVSEENEGPLFVSRKSGHELFCDYYFDLIKTHGELGLRENILPLVQHIAHTGWKEQYAKEFQNFPSQIVNSTYIGGNRTLLHMAATSDNADALKLLLQHFSGVDCEDVLGITPAFLAAKQGRLDNVKHLVKRGARINHKTKSVRSIFALWEDTISKARNMEHVNWKSQHDEISFTKDFVLEAKTNLWESTMLHAAAQGGHSDVVRFLLESKSFASTPNGVHLTPLHLAAESGHTDVVKCLYESGASADQIALRHAATNNRLQVVKYLLQIGVKDVCMRCDGSFYWLSGKNRWPDFENVANLELFDDDHLIRCESALHAAVSSGHESIVKLLASQKHNAIDCHDYTGRTPLHEAARKNSTSLVRILINFNAKVKKGCRFWQNLEEIEDRGITEYRNLGWEESLKYGQDVCHCGYTPFHLAARYGFLKLGVQLFGEWKANAEARDCTGATPLHVAACHNKEDMAYLLTHPKVGAMINRRSHNGSTPLHSAASCGAMEIIKFLLNHGANISATDQNGMTALHYSILHVRPADCPLRVLVNETVTDSDPSIDQPRVVEIDRRGRLAVFHKANGYVKNTFGFRWLDTFFHLVLWTSPPELNAMDKESRAVLHYAAMNGLADAVNVLVQRGARLDKRDKHGKTALDLAVENSTCVLVYPFILRKSFEDLKHDLRDHMMAVHLLLSSGASFKKCDRHGSLLHRAITNSQPCIVRLLLLKGASLKCRDQLGRTPLLSYLHNGGRYTDVFLQSSNAPVVIKCRKPFNTSVLHFFAFAYKEPTVEDNNFFLKRISSEDTMQSYEEDGPLTNAIKNMASNSNVLDTCLDAEGFTALHRAAQGANILAIKSFLALNANVSVPSPYYGLDALQLAVLHRGGYMRSWNSKPMPMPIFPNPDAVSIQIPSGAVLELLRHALKYESLKVRCDTSKAELTLYHLAASRGLVQVVEELLSNQSLYGLDVHCPNKHGLTPMYLAKLYSVLFPEDSERVVDVIKKHGGELRYPDKEVERYVILNLFGHHPESLKLRIDQSIRSFLQAFTQSFDTPFTCDEGMRNYNMFFHYHVVGEIFNQITTYGRLRKIVAFNVSRRLRSCLSHWDPVSKIADQFNDVSTEALKTLFGASESNNFSKLLRAINEKKLTLIYETWKNEMRYRDCLQEWLDQNRHWLPDIATLLRIFRRDLDRSRKRYLPAICSACIIVKSWSYYSRHAMDYEIPLRPKSSNFLGRMSLNEFGIDWPLDFLVNLALGDFAHLKYLEVLNIALDPKTRAHSYSDMRRENRINYERFRYMSNPDIINFN